MGNFLTNNQSENDDTSAQDKQATLTIGNITEGCIVKQNIVNEGEINFQTDGKTNIKVGNVNKNNEANDILNRTKVNHR